MKPGRFVEFTGFNHKYKRKEELIMMAKSPYTPPEDWTSEQIQAKLENLINHVERLKDD